VTRRALTLAGVACLLLVPALAAGTPVVLPSEAWFRAQVETLAAPAMEGRAAGTAGGDRAARYLAAALAVSGLRPGGADGTFLEPFVVATGPRLAADGANVLAPAAPAGPPLAPGRDWTPHGGAPRATVEGELVVAGYGLAAAGRDDYRGMDVRGRVVMVLDGAPSDFPGRTSRLDKLLAARARGARAVLVVEEPLPALEATATTVDLPSASLTPAAADRLLAPAGLRVAALRARAERAAPIATGLGVRLTTALALEERRAVNVIGILPGADPLRARERVVIGAHYDHLGQPGGVLHPGADDNASGTALVLALAQAFAAAGSLPRPLVVAFFGGEELGLLGSTHHVARGAAGTVAMLNVDMVGRLEGRALRVGGVASGAGLRALVVEAARDLGVPVAVSESPYAASDHLPFYRAGVPVLFLSTGVHDDYHRPTDTPDRVDVAGLRRVTAFAARLVAHLAVAEPPAYVSLPPPARAVRAPPGRAALGVTARPEAGEGVRVADVLPASAAARLGLRRGDVIVRVAGLAVRSVEELRATLGARRPGDRVEVVYLREGRPQAGTVDLGAWPEAR